MIGAILGDIIGSSYEFNPTFTYDFKLFPEGCNYTDDTVCTVGVADAILNHRTYVDSVHEWCRNNKCPKGGFGGSFARWVQSEDPRPYNSFGNGSAMRVSPVGWLFNTEEDVLMEAEKSAIISHDHPEGIKGAQAIAVAVYMARNGHSMDDIVLAAEQKFGYDISNNCIDNYVGKFDETCQGTVPAAFIILREATSFEDAIRRAVSIGADADTIGAIVGSVAEAYWGVPDKLKKRALSFLPKEMKSIVNQFYKRTS